MIIEKDKILNRWVIWKKEKAILIEIFRGNTKRDCLNFIKKEVKNGK